jgi:hypothetical protein
MSLSIQERWHMLPDAVISDLRGFKDQQDYSGYPQSLIS